MWTTRTCWGVVTSPDGWGEREGEGGGIHVFMCSPRVLCVCDERHTKLFTS